MSTSDETTDATQDQNQSAAPAASGGKRTPIDPSLRRTGQGAEMDVRPGAAPEAPGTDNPRVEGGPNQGTEAR